MALQSSSSEPISSAMAPAQTSLLSVFDSSLMAKTSLFSALHRSFTSPSLHSLIMSDEDPSTMTLEFLRARLQSQRAEYRAEKRRAQALAHKVVELEKKLLRMEIRLRNSSREENHGIGKSALPSKSSGLDGAGSIDVSEPSKEELQLQLEQYYPDDSACRCASDCSLRDSNESTANHYKNNVMNAAGYGSCELRSLSSPECYSPCSHFPCVRRQQRIPASPPPKQEDNSSKVYGRSPSRCFQKRGDKLPRPDNGDPNESQARQWRHETTSVVHGRWRDHEQHDLASKVRSGSHEIMAEEEINDGPLTTFCRFPSIPRYQGSCSSPRSSDPGDRSPKVGLKHEIKSVRASPQNQANNDREISGQRKLQISLSYMSLPTSTPSFGNNSPCCTIREGRLRPFLAYEKPGSYLQKIGIGKKRGEKVHPVANPVMYLEPVTDENAEDCEEKTKETIPELVHNPLFDPRASKIGYVEIDSPAKKNCFCQARECILESKTNIMKVERLKSPKP